MTEENGRAGGQYLSFELDGELFGLEVGTVREVLEFSSITRVPRAPDYMRGVINLRGNVVAVIDLKRRFGAEATVTTDNTCIVIIEVEIDGEPAIVGLLADGVQEVTAIEPKDIEPPPSIGSWLRAEYITGMVRAGEHFLMLLDIKRVFQGEAVAAIIDGGEEEEEEAAPAEPAPAQ